MAATTTFNIRKKIGGLLCCKLKSLFKHKKEEKTSINDLPDEVLLHILSFLPIRVAFRTMVLSKKWLTLCYLLPNLHFSSEQFDLLSNIARQRILFRQMLDIVMFSPHSHHHLLVLKSFHLKCFFKIWEDEEDECFIFEKWIEAAKQRGVEDIHLCLFAGLFPVHLPPTTIFSCKTVVVMTLERIHITNMFHCVVDLPLLKTLKLWNNVHFEVGKDFMKLLSRCPKLEDLKIRSVIANDGVRVGDYLKPLSTLINARISLFEVPYTAVFNVKYLTVSEFGLSFPNEEINSFYKGFPVFQNLIKLQLYWRSYILRPHILHDWDEVLKMLPYCPKLQTLKIEKAFMSLPMEDWEYPRRVPDCVSSNLTTCEIIGYDALKEDFQFATYILQNARLLQIMNIFTVYPKPKVNPQFLDDLSSCPRISPICKLTVSSD
ncbi:F-box/LRR-repeat protein [Trifolium medium]|uniref:F-box/LRR-repeat protein n=1 Tax=Trifolium medium TaxID=97028 RepID=A0A392M851_9FABA|nr:F-box/LRR-repeat protein [Trifolium medium]